MYNPEYKPLPETPLTRLAKWKARAIVAEPILQEAVWAQTAAYRTTNERQTPPKTYIEGLFRNGFPENVAKVTVTKGMSTGGVACAKEFDGVRKYMGKNDYVFLVAAEGFYLPSIDRANNSYEIMSHQIGGRQILAAARIDAVDDSCSYGGGWSCLDPETKEIWFNHGFIPPPWLRREELQEKLVEFLKMIRGERTPEKREECKAVCQYLGFPPLM